MWVWKPHIRDEIPSADGQWSNCSLLASSSSCCLCRTRMSRSWSPSFQLLPALHLRSSCSAHSEMPSHEAGEKSLRKEQHLMEYLPLLLYSASIWQNTAAPPPLHWPYSVVYSWPSPRCSQHTHILLFHLMKRLKLSYQKEVKQTSLIMVETTLLIQLLYKVYFKVVQIVLLFYRLEIKIW